MIIVNQKTGQFMEYKDGSSFATCYNSDGFSLYMTSPNGRQIVIARRNTHEEIKKVLKKIENDSALNALACHIPAY